MRRFAFSIGASFAAYAACATLAMASSFGPLVTPSQLKAGLASTAPIILDIRAKGYDAGHIEGAISAPYGLFRGPSNDPGQVPALDKLEASYERLGLTLDRPVVVVSQGDTDSDFGAAARVYWTLKSSGFKDLSILNGGASNWANAGFAFSTTPVTPAPTQLSIQWNNAWTADTPAVNQIVEGQAKAILVDARPTPFFEGKKMHDAAARPGTLPGAQNLPYSQFFSPGATAIAPKLDVTALKVKLGIQDGDEVVSFCNTGHWAATDWFALSELAGIDNVKLYPGSMVEYSATDGEMANTPGLIANFLNQLRGGN
ncbi:sulfurtransferase [Thioclava sp. 15-R06ZXC-3]|uniref:Sulfurtransferase n=1 Tax=Thioclava arctica TaxID=3238301 RepID=A0ABV3TPB0_9RHOB